MLNHNHFYFNTIKTYIIAISHILDDIHVIRTNSSGDAVKEFKVPITYSGKTKLYYKLQQNQDRNVSTILPRISFIFDSMQRDSTRSTLYSNTIKFTDNGISEEFQYNPLSYNYNFTASIWTKYMDDLLQIIEQIATFFDPDFNVTVNEIPALNITKNISILLNDIDVQTDNDFSDDDRMLTADLTFTLKGFLYKPISKLSIIRHIKANMINNNTEAKEVLQTIEHRWNALTENIDSTITEV